MKTSLRHSVIAATAVVLLAACAATATIRHVRNSDVHRAYLDTNGWPRAGQAAYALDGTVHVGPRQLPVPIASVAKVMTAYVVLRHLPLRGRAAAPFITISSADVRDYLHRRSGGQSVTRVRAGEQLSERQALTALMLPSANNVAVLLARRAAGTVPRFVTWMNATARQLGMLHTHYNDPSGYDPRTVSTSVDQLRLALVLAGDGPAQTVITEVSAMASARLPVAGRVRNTDALLGHDAFVGTKTGSDDAAGGCFMFRSYRVVRGKVTDLVGVVLGQRGRHDITAGLMAARELADRLGPAARA